MPRPTPEKGPNEKSKTPAENLGRYKSYHPEPGVLLPGTAVVLQQATRRFGKCSLRRQRVLDRWQLRELDDGHDISGRLLCLLETVPLSGQPELNRSGSAV